MISNKSHALSQGMTDDIGAVRELLLIDCMTFNNGIGLFIKRQVARIYEHLP